MPVSAQALQEIPEEPFDVSVSDAISHGRTKTKEAMNNLAESFRHLLIEVQAYSITTKVKLGIQTTQVENGDVRDLYKRFSKWLKQKKAFDSGRLTEREKLKSMQWVQFTEEFERLLKASEQLMQVVRRATASVFEPIELNVEDAAKEMGIDYKNDGLPADEILR